MTGLVRNITIVLISLVSLWVAIVIADIVDFPAPPVTEYDEKIIDQTLILLNEQYVWNKACNRDCNDITTLSLYCALAHASLNVTGDFNHNSAALEQVREEILDFSKQSDFEHILMDFNNDPDVSIDDIQTVLKNAKHNLNKKWKEKNSVLDWFSSQIRAIQSN